MLKLIAAKLATMYAVYATTLFCKMCETSRKIHIDYHLGGVAKISAIDKLELDRTDDEIFFMDDLTAKVSQRFNSGYYRTHKIIMSGEGEVDLDSFKARVMVNGEEVVMNRDEYLASRPYRQDQARIVYPDGRVNTDADFVQRVISKVEQPEQEMEYANDDSFALAI